jgi:GT2 family glycosyltransferase
MSQAAISLSVVSHGQIKLVEALFQDLAKHCLVNNFEVLLTLNIPEDLPTSFDKFSFPLLISRNATPLGFGENHNQAFIRSQARYFCVVNPDIRVDSNILPSLIEALSNPSMGVVAPLIVNGAGSIEDSARKFPTPFRILCKALGGCRGHDYGITDTPVEPDWVAGMFMMFRREVYEQLGGFDEKFFLYYEDVDLCARIRLSGLDVALIPWTKVTHLARRSSHTNPAYSLIHIRSMFRFFVSLVFLRVMFNRRS